MRCIFKSSLELLTWYIRVNITMKTKKKAFYYALQIFFKEMTFYYRFMVRGDDKQPEQIGGTRHGVER